MASAGDIHSILHRGDVLKPKVPRFDPSKHVQRYYPGKTPNFDNETNDFNSSKTTFELKCNINRAVTENPLCEKNSRLILLENLSVVPNDSESTNNIHSSLNKRKGRRVIETGLVLRQTNLETEKNEDPISVSQRNESVSNNCSVTLDSKLTQNSITETIRNSHNQIFTTSNANMNINPNRDQRNRVMRRNAALDKIKQENTQNFEHDKSIDDIELIEQTKESLSQLDASDSEITNEILLEEDNVVCPIFLPASKRLIQKKKKKKLQEKISMTTEKLKQDERVKNSKELLLKTLSEENLLDKKRQELESIVWTLENMPDDCDATNEEKEYQLWKQREIKRALRDWDESQTLMQLQKQINSRRQMTDKEREADDMCNNDVSLEHAKKKRKYRFMQKYYHKGVFFQDLAQDNTEKLYLRDFNEPVGEDILDKLSLPNVMRLRRGQFGKAGQVKHTHLVDVDTTDYTAAWAKKDLKATSHSTSKVFENKNSDQFSRPSCGKHKLE